MSTLVQDIRELLWYVRRMPSQLAQVQHIRWLAGKLGVQPEVLDAITPAKPVVPKPTCINCGKPVDFVGGANGPGQFFCQRCAQAVDLERGMLP